MAEAEIGGGPTRRAPAKWTVQSHRFADCSPPFSLYFGIPGKWNCATQPTASGTETTAPVKLPLTATQVVLDFWTLRDTLQLRGQLGDTYNVEAVSVPFGQPGDGVYVDEIRVRTPCQ